MGNAPSPNDEAFRRLCAGNPVLYSLRQARDILPAFFRDRALLHVSPPISVDRMCGPVRGAIECAMVYEDWSPTYEEAGRLLAVGGVRLSTTHDNGFVGPVAGVVSPSMWVLCVKNETFGNWSYSPINEGMGRALRFGAQGDDVIRRMKWLETLAGPVLAKAFDLAGGIELNPIIQRALEMGDECHNRHEAARLLLLRRLFCHLAAAAAQADVLGQVTDYLADNYYFFVNVSMAACKAVTDPMSGIAGSTLVTAMARNGTDFGIRVSGAGSRWFTAPCNRIHGVCFDGYTEADGNPDLGDSSITETAGLGAFAMAASPAIGRYIGGMPDELLRDNLEMYKITHDEHPLFRIPQLGYRGAPTGIDVCKVVTSGVAPVINTSISHKLAGIGQIGAGRTTAPLQCFETAVASCEVANESMTTETKRDV